MGDRTVLTLIALASILLTFVYYEKRVHSIKYISLIATFSALVGISRVPFVALPNIQPATFLIIISGYVFGPIFGFMVGTISVLVSNSILGHGAWTLWQMTAWGLTGFSSGILKKIVPKANSIILGIFAFMWGFFFGWIINLWYWLTYIYPLNLKTFLSVCTASFYFDWLHAIGNFVFAFIFGKDLISIISRLKRKIT